VTHIAPLDYRPRLCCLWGRRSCRLPARRQPRYLSRLTGLARARPQVRHA
jgi:hypothetical protein